MNRLQILSQCDSQHTLNRHLVMNIINDHLSSAPLFSFQIPVQRNRKNGQKKKCRKTRSALEVGKKGNAAQSAGLGEQ